MNCTLTLAFAPNGAGKATTSAEFRPPPKLCAGRVMVNSAGDWGHSDPLAVPEFMFEMRARGHDEALIRKVVHDNPLNFWRQANNWKE